MSYPGPGAQPTALLVDGAPVSTTNPLPISGSGSSTVLPVELRGLQQNQTTLKSVGVDNLGNLGASIADPLTAFNELLVAEPRPRVQIDAAYGLLTTDIESRTSDLRLEPGDVLAVALQTASSTATADVSLNWHEE